jgi:uncharacterized membrane protein YfcA
LQLNLDPHQIALAILFMAAGTAVQASIGFGLAMVAAPLLYIVEPAFVPGPIIACALLLSIWVVRNEWHAVDYAQLWPAIAGRLIGSPLGALVIGSLTATTFDIVFGLLVLAAVGISLLHGNIQPNGKTVFFGTMASGFMGTISSIGGPPIALVYQNRSGAELRGNLSLMFLIGTFISLVSLGLVGRFGLDDLLYVAVLLVGVVIGVAISIPLKRRLDKRTARPFLLGLCALSASTVLLQACLALR